MSKSSEEFIKSVRAKDDKEVKKYLKQVLKERVAKRITDTLGD